MRFTICQYQTDESLGGYQTDLIGLLNQCNPRLRVEFEFADKSFKEKLNSWEQLSDSVVTLESVIDTLAKPGSDPNYPRVLIDTAPDSNFTKKAVAETELTHARWGFSKMNYSPSYACGGARLTALLYESLHLFGADDCYCSNNQCKPLLSCKNERCLMRYDTVSADLEICDVVRNSIASSTGGV